jgi:hypothetical protein
VVDAIRIIGKNGEPRRRRRGTTEEEEERHNGSLTLHPKKHKQKQTHKTKKI